MKRLALVCSIVLAVLPWHGGARGETGTDPALDQIMRRVRSEASTSGGAAAHEARQQWLNEAESALAHGELDRAAALFEQAGSVRHAADAELGLIRTYMQGGEYRRALAFAAHTAGAHPDAAAGTALYAWLLLLGGQTRIAQHLLERAQARLPNDATLAATAEWLKSPSRTPAPLLLAAPARFAPFSPQSQALPATARVVGSATLVAAGRLALAPLADIGDAQALYVRDATGRLAAAKTRRRFDAIGLIELELDPPLAAALPSWPQRDPFPGSPGYAVEFARSEPALPAWPLLRIGFLGGPTATPGVHELGIDAPEGARGGPVFDAAGRLVGVAVTGTRGRSHIVLPSSLRQHADGGIATVSSEAAPIRIPIDELYERALQTVVQLIRVP